MGQTEGESQGGDDKLRLHGVLSVRACALERINPLSLRCYLGIDGGTSNAGIAGSGKYVGAACSRRWKRP